MRVDVVTDADAFPKLAEAAFINAVPRDAETYTETREQFAAVRDAVHGILASAACGTGPWAVDVTGHANPGHTNRAGWSHDSVTVTIHQW
jgi:hypothetical protein